MTFAALFVTEKYDKRKVSLCFFSGCREIRQCEASLGVAETGGKTPSYMTFAALFVSEKREKKKSFFMILLSDQKRDKEKVSHRAEKSAPSFFRKHKNRTATQSCFCVMLHFLFFFHEFSCALDALLEAFLIAHGIEPFPTALCRHSVIHP